MKLTTRAVLFDLDGTLLDTAPDMASALNRLRLQEQLAPLELATVRPHVSNGARAMVRLGFGVDQGEAGFDALRQRFLLCYEQGLCIDTRPFPGIEAVLDALERSGVPWGVVTNKPGWLTVPLLESLQLAHRAAVVVSGDTTPQRKPEPEPLLHACRTLELRPGDCTYVGDSARDMEAALRAGMKALAATFGYIPAGDDPSGWGAHALVGSPDQILHRLTASAA